MTRILILALALLATAASAQSLRLSDVIIPDTPSACDGASVTVPVHVTVFNGLPRSARYAVVSNVPGLTSSTLRPNLPLAAGKQGVDDLLLAVDLRSVPASRTERTLSGVLVLFDDRGAEVDRRAISLRINRGLGGSPPAIRPEIVAQIPATARVPRAVPRTAPSFPTNPAPEPVEIRPTAPVSTTPVFIENRLSTVPIWRTQLRVHTCDLEGAESDEDVWVQLTDNPADRFWLDRGGDDRLRDGVDVWDVVPSLLSAPIRGSMITRIQFGTTGNDGWCFDRVELYFNYPYRDGISPVIRDRDLPRTRVFERDLEPTWIKGGASRYPHEVVVADRADLYLSDSWTQAEPMNFQLAPLAGPRNGIVGLSNDALASMIEGIVGHLMGPGSEAQILGWGNRSGARYVDFLWESPTRIRVDLDLGSERGLGSRVSDVDITFDLVASCSDATIRLDVVDFEHELSTWGRAVHVGAAGLTEAFMYAFTPDDRPGAVQMRLPGTLSCSDAFGFTREGDLRVL